MFSPTPSTSNRKAETVARYGQSAVDHDLPLADKLRRDGDRTGPSETTVMCQSRGVPVKVHVDNRE